MNNKKNFKIFRSAAGSGKTYTLVKEYIKIALLGNGFDFSPSYFKHILAITFTNKAASEMKSRVFYFLVDLKNGKGQDDPNSFFSQIKNETKLDEHIIKDRSSRILQSILHSYYNFSISTIDKFVYRIVRTFAHDLQMSQNFEVELDSYKLIQPTVSSLIEKIGIDKDVTEALLEFAYTKVEEGNSYNVEKSLESFSKFIFIEQSEKYLKELEKISVKDCLDVKDDLHKKIKIFEKQLDDFSHTFLTFCLEKQLEPKSFYKSVFYNYFKNLKKHDLDKLHPGKELVASMEAERWYSKGLDDYEKQKIDENKLALSKMYSDVMQFIDAGFKDYVFQKLFVKNIYSVAVFNELNKELNIYKKENNLQHISEFNNSISKIVRNEPVPFIYERLGDRYFHFLIDEFQDTSVKQWHNLLPLVNNSLAMDKQNLIVGDAKQSIYRWRGGEVEQFLRLPDDVFQKELLPNEEEITSAIKRNAQEEKLKYNWRSSQQIVNFNNRFFSKMKELISPDYKSIYQNHEQIPMGDENGYIQIDFSPKDKLSKDVILIKLIAKIKELIDLGYNCNDMAILCRTRNDSVLVARSITEHGIKVISDEALLLKNSPKVVFLVSFLHYLQENNDKIAKTNIVSFLNSKNVKCNHHEILNSLSSANNDLFDQFLFDNSYGLNIREIKNLPLYDLVEHLIQCFHLESSNVYLQFFLDVILKFSSKISNDIGEFLEWWSENKLKQAIEVSEDSNAVKIMTVHKSKGLEFPIVFIPFNWLISKSTKELWVDVKDKSSDLKVALISNNKLLEKTNLSEIRTHEKEMSLLDDINVLYVAMTRPKSQLYLFIEESSGDQNNYNTLSKLFDYYFRGSDIVNYYKEGMVLPFQSSIKKSNKDAYQLSYNSVKNWRDVVHLKNTSNQLWDVELGKKEWGTQLHAWLSKIHYYDQKDSVLEELLKDHSVSAGIKNKLIERINQVFKSDELKSFFSAEWMVKTETEILLPSGETYIPDRVVTKENQVKVIDYKTGSILKLEAHKTQLINYSDILSRMGYDNIELYLVYIDENIKIIKI